MQRRAEGDIPQAHHVSDFSWLYKANNICRFHGIISSYALELSSAYYGVKRLTESFPGPDKDLCSQGLVSADLGTRPGVHNGVQSPSMEELFIRWFRSFFGTGNRLSKGRTTVRLIKFKSQNRLVFLDGNPTLEPRTCNRKLPHPVQSPQLPTSPPRRTLTQKA